MLCLVAVVRTDVSKEGSASIIWVTRIGKLGTTLAVTSNQCTLQELHGVTSQKTAFFTVMFLVKKFPDERGSLRQCVIVMQEPVLLLPQFRLKS
jgi:hypothetical protein